MTHVLEIEWSDPSLPGLVGPFETRTEAETWARLNVVNGSWNVAPLAHPYAQSGEQPAAEGAEGQANALLALADDIDFVQTCWARWKQPGVVVDARYRAEEARVEEVTARWRRPAWEGGPEMTLPLNFYPEAADAYRWLAQRYGTPPAAEAAPEADERGEWRVEPPAPRDTRPADTYDVIDDDGLPVAWPLANLTFEAASAVAEAHNAARRAAQTTTNPCCTGTERIEGHWLVEVHQHHTCGAGGPEGHERGCGLVPLVDLRGLDGWDSLVQEMHGQTTTEWGVRRRNGHVLPTADQSEEGARFSASILDNATPVRREVTPWEEADRG